MRNPNVIKLVHVDYPVDPPDFQANVYERHPSRGDVFLYTHAVRDTPEAVRQAATTYITKHPQATFLPTEDEKIA